MSFYQMSSIILSLLVAILFPVNSFLAQWHTHTEPISPIFGAVNLQLFGPVLDS